MTVIQLASRGPVIRAAVSASQLSPENAVIGLCELVVLQILQGQSWGPSLRSRPLRAIMEKGH